MRHIKTQMFAPLAALALTGCATKQRPAPLPLSPSAYADLAAAEPLRSSPLSIAVGGIRRSDGGLWVDLIIEGNDDAARFMASDYARGLQSAIRKSIPIDMRHDGAPVELLLPSWSTMQHGDFTWHAATKLVTRDGCSRYLATVGFQTRGMPPDGLYTVTPGPLESPGGMYPTGVEFKSTTVSIQ